MSFGIRGKSPLVTRSLDSVNPVDNYAYVEPLEPRQLLSVSPLKPAGVPNLGVLPGAHVTTDPSTEGTVTGAVTDSSGNPLANATVYLKAVDSSGGATPDAISFPIIGRLIAQTDSNGDFTLSTVPANTYTATAFKQGFVATTSASFTVTAGASTTVPMIALPAVQFGTVTGTVDDSTGAPVSGALVFLRPDNSSGGPPVSPVPVLSGIAAGGQYFATTDSSGNYTINNVPTGTYTATGSAKGDESSTTASFTVATGSNTAPAITLTVRTAPVTGTVTGNITDSSGNPLSGALVTLTVDTSSGSTTPTPSFRLLFATTDSSGNYTINNVPAGSYDVNASDKGYVKNTSAAFTVAAGSNTAPTVALTAIVTGTVTGTITDSNGNNLSGARVTLTLVPSTTGTSSGSAKPKAASLVSLFGGGQRVFSITTDSSGDYTIDNVPTGNYTISVTDKGFQKSTGTAFTVAAGSNSVPTITLTALPTPVFGSLTGSVTDSSGNEITNARVIITPVIDSTSGTTPTPGPHAHVYFAKTDSTGTFTLNKVLAGTYTITAFAKGFTKNTSASFTVASGTNTAPTVALTASTTTGSGSNSGSTQ